MAMKSTREMPSLLHELQCSPLGWVLQEWHLRTRQSRRQWPNFVPLLTNLSDNPRLQLLAGPVAASKLTESTDIPKTARTSEQSDVGQL